MTTIIILAIALAVGQLVFNLKEKVDWWYGFLPMFFFGAFCGAVAAAFIPVKYERVDRSFQLESMNDGQSVKGHFFLGTGSVDGVFKYSAYIKEGENEYWLLTVPTTSASISYTGDTPTVGYIYFVRKRVWWNYFGFGINKPDDYYWFNIPAGSIKNNFVLDAQ
jgi:hypothetical protein